MLLAFDYKKMHMEVNGAKTVFCGVEDRILDIVASVQYKGFLKTRIPYDY
jgi:hypothetical protein